MTTALVPGRRGPGGLFSFQCGDTGISGLRAGRAFAKKPTISLIAGDYLAYVWWPLAASPSARGKPLAVVRPKRQMLDGEKVIPKTTLLLLTVKSSRVGKPSRFASVAVIGDGDTLLLGLIDSHVQISAEGVLTAALALGVTLERAQSGFRPSNLERRGPQASARTHRA